MRLLIFPQDFKKGCSETTATYTLSGKGIISVLYECKKNDKVKLAKGKAKVVDKTNNAKLKVSFFWPFYGDYWIIKLGADHDYAVVETPNRRYLWILRRTAQMNDKIFSQLIDFVKSKGFNVGSLIKTSHS